MGPVLAANTLQEAFKLPRQFAWPFRVYVMARIEGYELRLMPSAPLSCFTDVSELFGFGQPKELDSLHQFPRRDKPIPCDEWIRRLGW